MKKYKLKNNNSIETVLYTNTTVRSNIKYLFPRANDKPVLSTIRFLELCYSTKLTDDEKKEIWNLFYGGHN